MSTSFRIGGRGKKLTRNILRKMAVDKGWTITKTARNVSTLILKTPGGYLHVYKTGRTAYNAFERFGGNNPMMFVTALIDAGYHVYDEYHDNFIQCRGHKT